MRDSAEQAAREYACRELNMSTPTYQTDPPAGAMWKDTVRDFEAGATWGYAAGREQAFREAVAWLRAVDPVWLTGAWAADQLEHGALAEVPGD